VTKANGFDYDLLVDFVESCTNFYLGFGSFWGSAAASYDDVMIHDRALESSEVRELSNMAGRVTDFTIGEGGTDIKSPTIFEGTKEHHAIYDLTGRKVTQLKRGIYICNGKKFFVK
jgi:arabinan endo-1,5-alpha-L-arabinosidase